MNKRLQTYSCISICHVRTLTFHRFSIHISKSFRKTVKIIFSIKNQPTLHVFRGWVVWKHREKQNQKLNPARLRKRENSSAIIFREELMPVSRGFYFPFVCQPLMCSLTSVQHLIFPWWNRNSEARKLEFLI